MTRPFLLADDLSGALEAGAAFRAHGWRVRVPLEDGESIQSESGELVVISTESRNLKAGAAAAKVRQVLTRLSTPGARLLFKKIDSTLRGPVGAELKALMTELEPPLVVLCVANPPVGRTVCNGILHVNGVPLEQSDFRFDPVWPALTGDIRALLKTQGVAHVELLTVPMLRGAGVNVMNRVSQQGTRRCAVLVADATTMDDIATLFDVICEVEPDAIWVGSGALGAVMARKGAGPVREKTSTAKPLQRMLVISGSRHLATRMQMDHLDQAQVARVLEVNVSSDMQTSMKEIRAAMQVSPVTAIRFVIDPSLEQAAKITMVCAAKLAAAIDQNCPCDVLYLTGGETAAVVCRAMGGRSLEIIRELEPGVVVGILKRPLLSDLTVVIKPGGFGSAQAMATHIQLLMSRDP